MLVIRIAAITLASDSAITIARFRPSKLSYYKHNRNGNLSVLLQQWYLLSILIRFNSPRKSSVQMTIAIVLGSWFPFREYEIPPP